MADINDAIVARANIKGLDQSIAPFRMGSKGLDPLLYLDDESNKLAQDSAPAEEDLPRVRFVAMDAESTDFTPECRTVRHDFFIFLYGTTPELIETYRLLVKSVFENGHVDPEDPFTIAGCNVSELDLVDWEDHPGKYEVAYSQMLFRVLYSEERNLAWPPSVS